MTSVAVGRVERRNKVVADSYVNPKQEFTDAEVAASLCHGEPCAYRPHKEATNVTPAWLLEHVVPHLNHFYGHGPNASSPALLLAYPLLWAAMSPEMENRMDEDQRKRIRDEYEKIRTLPVGVNPVVRVHLRVFRHKNLLLIDELPGDGESATASTTGHVNGPVTGISSSPQDFNKLVEMFVMHQQQMKRMHQTQQRAMETMIANLDGNYSDRLATINHNLCR